MNDLDKFESELQNAYDVYTDIIDLHYRSYNELEKLCNDFKNESFQKLSEIQPDKKGISKLKKFYCLLSDFKELCSSYDQQYKLLVSDRQSLKKLTTKLLDIHLSENSDDISIDIKDKIEHYENLTRSVRVNMEYRILGLSRSKSFILFLGKDVNKSYRKIRDLNLYNFDYIDKIIEYSIKYSAFETKLGETKHRIEILCEKRSICRQISQMISNTSYNEAFDIFQKWHSEHNRFTLSNKSGIECKNFINDETVECLFKDLKKLDSFIEKNNIKKSIESVKNWLKLCDGKLIFSPKYVGDLDIVRSMLLYSKELISSPYQYFLLVDLQLE